MIINHQNFSLSNLQGKKILVTGATGFIGGRVVERLVLEEGAEVVALVHQYRNAVRLARFPVRLIQGDITDAECVAKAAEGCDAIVHAAVSFAGTAEQNQRVTVEGARNVCESAKKLGIRLVHFSTFSVYGETRPGRVDEDSIKNPSGDAYGASKWEAEQLVQEYQAAGLQASILQPTLVYGPWSFWSTHTARLVSTGTLMLPDLEQGLCNAVYVDDVVEAVLLCLKMEKCLCGPFLISGSEPVKWGEFLKGHAKNPADVTLERMSAEELAEFLPKGPVAEPLTLRTFLPQSFRYHLKGALLQFPGFKRFYKRFGILRWLNRGARQIVGAPKQQVTSKEKPKVHATEKINKVYPGREHIPLFQSRSSISIEKAAKELGYNPKFNLDSGTKLTRSWLEWANIYN